MNRNKNRAKKREERQTNEKIRRRGVIVTTSDFTKSFKAVKNSFFQVKVVRPKTEIEKILYVSDNDLEKALKILIDCEKTTECKSQKNYIELDEKFINRTFEKIIH